MSNCQGKQALETLCALKLPHSLESYRVEDTEDLHQILCRLVDEGEEPEFGHSNIKIERGVFLYDFHDLFKRIMDQDASDSYSKCSFVTAPELGP